MKVGIYTLGCKVNTYESEYVADVLENSGYTLSEFDDICDIYIINTCTVTNQSDSKSRKIIHQATRRNPNACIVAMGCFVEANKEIVIDGVDILIGNQNKSKIVSLIQEYFKTHQPIRHLACELGTEFEDMEIKNFKERTRAFVKIQDGCENFCTYCIIPYVRGKCRSKQRETVIREIMDLVVHGYQEIVLTGIHIGNYGVDLGDSFYQLLQDILRIHGLKRLRISSIEVTELTDPVLSLLEENDIICDHLHIPLQAGSDSILKAMNRKYDLDYFRHKLENIRKIRPNISISTDIIVGFPGEDEEMFQQTLDHAREFAFTKIHVFPYSIRKGTPASQFPNQVDGMVKKKRSHLLMELSNELEEKYMKRFLGQKVLVLIEQNKSGFSFGHTSNYLYVKIKGEYPTNSMVEVCLTDVNYPCCIGLVTNDKMLLKV